MADNPLSRGIARSMRYTPFLVLAMFLSGCDRGDTRLRKELAGKWARDGRFELNLSADGGFDSHWSNPHSKLTYQGTWRVKDGCMVLTLTNCIAEGTTNFDRVGSADRCTIVRIDSTALVYSNEGKMISLSRK